MIPYKFTISIPFLYSIIALTSCNNDSIGNTREIAASTLRVDSSNPRYFADDNGKIIYLTGSHTWSNLQDVTGYDFSTLPFRDYLQLLIKNNHNFFRLWIIEHAWEEGKKVSISPHPWPRSGTEKALDGKPKFDLYKFDETYFNRLRSRVNAARRRGIYVSVMFFDDWSTEHEETWNGHPFNSNNNVNEINGDTNNDGLGLEFHTLQDSTITNLQEAYVRKVIDTVNDFNNVMYEVANETGISLDWQHHMVDVIKEYQKMKDKQHPVGMTVGFPVREVTNDAILTSDADWVSPNGDADYSNNPPAANGEKVIIIDTDHIWGVGGDSVWVWKCFLRGLNPIYMDDLGTSRHKKDVRRAMGHTLMYADKMNLKDMSPLNDLSSTTYCMANPGTKYLIYQPVSGMPFTVNLTAGQYNYEWFNPRRGTIVLKGSFTTDGENKSFKPPFRGDAILYIYAQ